MNASWMLNGTAGRWRGPAAEMAANIPAGATDVISAASANRLETFVTLGEPTTTVFLPTGMGIEMVPVTHPNDLVAEEAATFQFLQGRRALCQCRHHRRARRAAVSRQSRGDDAQDRRRGQGRHHLARGRDVLGQYRMARPVGPRRGRKARVVMARRWPRPSTPPSCRSCPDRWQARSGRLAGGRRRLGSPTGGRADGRRAS